MAPPAASVDEVVGDLASLGVKRVHVLAWRDLDDADAGGSEVHADEVMRRWAAAGLDVGRPRLCLEAEGGTAARTWRVDDRSVEACFAKSCGHDSQSGQVRRGREQAAALIHGQWQKHATSMMPHATPDRQRSWQDNFKPYDDLADEIQGYDRVESNPMVDAIEQAADRNDAIDAVAALEHARTKRWIETILKRGTVSPPAMTALETAVGEEVNSYDRAFATIMDSNVTMLIAAALLFMLGSGPVRGFAVTLILGVLTTVITAVTMTRRRFRDGCSGSWRSAARCS